MAEKGKIACLLGQEFEDSEFRIPYDRLTRAGYKIDVIGMKAGELVKGHKGREQVTIERTIDDVNVDDYVGLFIPGGFSPDHLRLDSRFVDFVKEFNDDRKTIAAVCHGPQLLLSAGLVKGRTLTAWPTVQRDLELAGANVKDQKVVVDDNWITSRKPDDLEAFSNKFIEELAEWERRGGPQPTRGMGKEPPVQHV